MNKIIAAFIIFLIIIALLVLLIPTPLNNKDAVAFTMKDVSGNKTIMSKLPLDAASARSVAEEVITVMDQPDYRWECLLFDSAEKRVDARNGKEFWSVGFRCNDECNTKFINCAAAVMIEEKTREVSVAFPD